MQAQKLNLWSTKIKNKTPYFLYDGATTAPQDTLHFIPDNSMPPIESQEILLLLTPPLLPKPTQTPPQVINNKQPSPQDKKLASASTPNVEPVNDTNHVHQQEQPKEDEIIGRTFFHA